MHNGLLPLTYKKKTQYEHNVLIYCNINILTDLKANVHDVSDIGWADKVHHYSVGAMRTCKYCNCSPIPV